MNVRDYDLIEHGVIIAGACLIAEWMLFSWIFGISMTGIVLIPYTLIGIMTIFIATVAHFKKLLFIQEMKGYIKKGEKHEMDSDTTQKFH